jgi:hypothetical protein
MIAVLSGLAFDLHAGAFLTAADGPTVTLDCARSDKHQVTLGGNRTLAVAGDRDGQQFLLILQQDATTGSRTVTWWGGIRWPGGVVPTLTTTPGKIDAFTFFRLSTGVYLGFTAGLNL